MGAPIRKLVEFELSPKEVANAFWHLNSREQAEFFNELGDVVYSGFSMQMRYVADDGHLSDAGRCAMQIIGEYGRDQAHRGGTK